MFLFDLLVCFIFSEMIFKLNIFHFFRFKLGLNGVSSVLVILVPVHLFLSPTPPFLWVILYLVGRNTDQNY